MGVDIEEGVLFEGRGFVLSRLQQVESTLKETHELKKQLHIEKAARSEGAKDARAAQAKAHEDIRKLSEALAKSQSSCAKDARAAQAKADEEGLSLGYKGGPPLPRRVISQGKGCE